MGAGAVDEGNQQGLAKMEKHNSPVTVKGTVEVDAVEVVIVLEVLEVVLLSCVDSTEAASLSLKEGK